MHPFTKSMSMAPTAFLLLLAVGVSSAFAKRIAEAVIFSREMVVTPHSLATSAGEEVLARGGTAVDAMIAIQTVLGLVEPQSSGIGGGAFVVYYDGKSDKLTTIDAREKAPAAATENRLEQFGNFFEAWQSGLSVGVPGVPKLMEYMHETYGNQKWSSLFRRAKRIAKRGFEISPRTEQAVIKLLNRNQALGYDCENRLFFRDPIASDYFLDSCEAKPAGTSITNPNYARLMMRLAKRGASGFYRGPVATAIVEAVTTDPNVPGDMTKRDLKNYEIVEREPICCEYNGFDVCGMGPPSSGALAICQQLGILETFEDFADSGDPLNDEVVHRIAMAGRLAFADRGRYVADSDFVTVPIEGMLDKEYLAMRAALIGDEDIGTAPPGEIDGFDPTMPSDMRAKDSGTSHFSIADRYGNVLSMTTTVESEFGNGVMVAGWGFLLNNQMTDFSFFPGTTEAPMANRAESGKRPRSSMSPTIVVNKTDGSPFLATGSAGGSRMIGYTLNTILWVTQFGLDPQEAVNMPHFLNRNNDVHTELEEPKDGKNIPFDFEGLKAALEARGHIVTALSSDTSSSNLIKFERGDDEVLLIGGADHRRGATVGGSN